jgi:hypothetical protein
MNDPWRNYDTWLERPYVEAGDIDHRAQEALDMFHGSDEEWDAFHEWLDDLRRDGSPTAATSSLDTFRGTDRHHECAFACFGESEPDFEGMVQQERSRYEGR